MTAFIGRREFIALIVGAAASWPFGARAQQPERVRRIGVLMPLGADDPEAQARIAAFSQTLEQLGWTEGRHNLRIDIRWGAGDADRLRKDATELAALEPNVILANGSAAVAALQLAARTVPIVFVAVIDPVGPGGNATGFTNYEYGISGKWLKLLKELAPDITRVLLMYDPETTPHDQFVRSVETAAPALGLLLTAVGVRDGPDIEHAFNVFAPQSDAALIVFPAVVTGTHRQLIIDLAARNGMPAIYPFRYFATIGGLVSYGIDPLESFRKAASYVDRILKGEKPADLPVQQPTKFELVINIGVAKVLGLTVPPTLLARANEVIE